MILLLATPVTVLPASPDEESQPALAEMSLDDIARPLSNPVTSLATLNSELEFRAYQGSIPGADGQSTFIYKFQPSIPIPLDNGKNILMRMTIPIYGNQPLYSIDYRHQIPEWRVRQIADKLPAGKDFVDGHDHLGDVGFDIAYGGVSDKGFISKYGVSTVWPSSQDLSSISTRFKWDPILRSAKSCPGVCMAQRQNT